MPKKATSTALRAFFSLYSYDSLQAHRNSDSPETWKVMAS